MTSLLLRNCNLLAGRLFLQKTPWSKSRGQFLAEETKRTVDLARLNRIADSLRALALHLAADAEGGTQNLLDNTLQVLREGLEPHSPRNVDDLVEGNRLVVLDVLLLLPVAGRLLERPDDERGCCGNDRDGGLTVLDRELDRHAETLL